MKKFASWSSNVGELVVFAFLVFVLILSSIFEKDEDPTSLFG